MKIFAVCKTQVYKILKKKMDIFKWWKNCANGKIKREIKITGNKDVQTEPDTMDTDALVQNFRESQNG
jgi:hypothetical protein